MASKHATSILKNKINIARAEALKISWDAIAKRTLELYLDALED